MQSRRSSFMTTIENLIDVIINVAAFVIAFIFAVIPIPPVEMTLDSPYTLVSIFVTVIIQSFLLMAFDINRPYTPHRAGDALLRIFKVNTLFYALDILLAAVITVEAEKPFVLVWLAFAYLISTGSLIFKKNLLIHISRFLQRGQYSLRKVIIVGDNTATAREFIKQVAESPESNIMIVGYVGDKIDEGVGADKLGAFKDLGRVLDEYHPKEVVFAIDGYDKRHLMKLVAQCDDRCIKVYFLPVIYGYFKSSQQIETLGTMPLINIHSTPLDHPFNAFMKRLIDIVGSLVLIILTSPIMLAAAIAVKISSPGPILFKQVRVGLMGKRFTMLKFRSMRVNTRQDTGWSAGIDDRKTWIGNFLRKTSIDELPQLFNVLIGDMSLVGPRPEVPHYVKHFKDIIPLYMVKHYVKPGITGLAQVRGLRGDTSIEERINADIEYIENWTLGMDIAIILKTPFKMFNKQERYVKSGQTEQTVETEALHVVEKTEAETAAAENTPEVLDAEPLNENEVKTGTRGKILYAASTMSHINNFHLDYIAALREDGYTVKVMARGDGADYDIPFEKKFFSSENAACRTEIKEILEHEKFDILLLNTSLAAYHIRMALPNKNRPRVINLVHGYLFSEDIGFLKRIALTFAEKLLAGKTDSIIVMNEWDRRVAEEKKLCLGAVHFCRGMGASVKEQTVSSDKLRRERGCQNNFVMCFVGELSDRKNQKFLIHAMNEIKEVIPNAQLWLVGDGKGRDKLEALAGRIDLSESVTFLGRRDNACDYMRACDLYVSASTIEGMPFNLIEAMGCGKTVLASRVKGHKDLIEEGKSGYLFKLDDMDDFVKKVVGFYKGELALNQEDIVSRYKEFAKETVFDETLDVIKRSFED